MIISFTNNKGGTGKTTTTVNLAAALALMGRRVLLVDLDPQGNSTVGVGLEKAKLLYTVYDVLTQNKKVQEVTLSTKVENLSILPSNLDLAGAEVELSSVPGREFVLREAMSQIKHKYDAILIDCPPNVGILTLNAIVASDLLVIPVQCEFYPMEGLPTLLKVMNMVRSRLKTNFEYRVLLTMYDSRTGLSKSVVRQVEEKRSDGPHSSWNGGLGLGLGTPSFHWISPNDDRCRPHLFFGNPLVDSSTSDRFRIHGLRVFSGFQREG